MTISAKAFLFDLNGTIIDDMSYHAEAWFDILNNDLGATLSKEEVKLQMYGKNNELLVRIFGDTRFTLDEMNALSVEKERRYQRAYLPKLELIRGLKPFLETAKNANVLMAIGSAAIPFNISFVLDNLHLHDYFPVVVSADDVAISKPDPETFVKCASLLGVDPTDCVVFEDAPKGVESAGNAGMRCFVLTTTHPKEDFLQYDNVIGFAEDYTDAQVG
ncbi:MAG: HAD family phosphatase [Bacteroidota bacterium]|nr:HAD family phosphatase [Ferruginibacter sp.]